MTKTRPEPVPAPLSRPCESGDSSSAGRAGSFRMGGAMYRYTICLTAPDDKRASLILMEAAARLQAVHEAGAHYETIDLACARREDWVEVCREFLP